MGVNVSYGYGRGETAIWINFKGNELHLIWECICTDDYGGSVAETEIIIGDLYIPLPGDPEIIQIRDNIVIDPDSREYKISQIMVK